MAYAKLFAPVGLLRLPLYSHEVLRDAAYKLSNVCASKGAVNNTSCQKLLLTPPVLKKVVLLVQTACAVLDI